MLLSIDGRSISEPNALQSAIALYRPDQELAVEVWRDGTRRFFDVQLFGRDDPTTQSWFAQLDRGNARPQEEDAGGSPHGQVVEVPEWGLGLFDVTARFQEMFGLKEGAYVAFVEDGGAADDAGLPRNVVILKVDGQAIATAEQAALLFRAAAGAVLVEIARRDGRLEFYEMSLRGGG